MSSKAKQIGVGLQLTRLFVLVKINVHTHTLQSTFVRKDRLFLQRMMSAQI